ncbi:MAG: universal stress protein [Acidobacteria bacterium]|nr:universal stress protein [Acidobacteriota bacterium]
MAVGAGLAGVISGDDPPGAEWSLSMIEIKRILVPIDFSDHSRHALDHAVAMARWYDSTITLLHVYSTVPVAAYAPGTTMHPSVAMTPMDRDALLALMRRFAEDEAGADRPIQCETCEGAAAAETLARAKALPADLIVMGTHGRSGFERLLLGSVTEKVLRKASCPVLSVPRGARDAVPALPVLFKDILSTIDFSDCSINALNYAMSLAAAPLSSSTKRARSCSTSSTPARTG